MLNQWGFVILLCLTLGLAPFFPEPHIISKIKWIASGLEGMQFIDWFDVLFHGFPYVLLLRLLFIHAKKRLTK